MEIFYVRIWNQQRSAEFCDFITASSGGEAIRQLQEDRRKARDYISYTGGQASQMSTATVIRAC